MMLQKEIFGYLDAVLESGVGNICTEVPRIQAYFLISEDEARIIHFLWMLSRKIDYCL